MYKNHFTELLKTQSSEVLSNILFAIYRLNSLGIGFDNDCISYGQLYSKLWIIYQLQQNKLIDLGTVFLCAGWYGILANFLLCEKGLNVKKVRSFDYNYKVEKIADIFNHNYVVDNWRFKAATYDIHDIDYKEFSYNVYDEERNSTLLKDNPDTIINTSCEHIDSFDDWYKSLPCRKLLILQSNDYHGLQEHINTCNDLENFQKQTPMSVEYYSGTLDCNLYTRFMRIGKK